MAVSARRLVFPLALLLALAPLACGSSDGDAGSSGAASGDGAGAAGVAGAAGESGQGGAPGAPAGVCGVAEARAFQDQVAEADGPCVLACKATCGEASEPWRCPAMADYGSFAHDCSPTACGEWDGTYPAPQAGKCQASEPTGEALAKTNAEGSPVVLPDGRRLATAGKESLFKDELRGTFPYSMIKVPGTSLVVVSDDGYLDNALRVVDTSKIGEAGSPELARQVFPAPTSLNLGLAFGGDGTLYAASGAPDSVIRAFSLDKATGALAALPARDVQLVGVFPAGIAVSPDGKTMVVGQVKKGELLVVSLDEPTYGQVTGTVDLGGEDHFGVLFDPASSDVVYVAVWGRDFVVEASLATGVVRKISTGKQPEQLAFLDPNYLVVADSLGDDLAVIDRAAAKVVATVPIAEEGGLHGAAPTALAFDAQAGRLYVALAARNGLAVVDVKPSTGAGAPPTLSQIGVVPTSWWPTGVVVDGPGDPSPGAVTVINGRGHGIGVVKAGTGAGADGMRGSIQRLEPGDLAPLDALTQAHRAASQTGKLAGAPEVTCPDGAPYDFPVPRVNTEGPSKLIDRIVFIVRENKTYDALFGDMPDADGDPDGVMAPGKMDQVFPNIRALAGQFAHGDNFYEDAEQSIQGHYWTSFGRSSDYTERTWLTTWGRGTRGPVPLQGVGGATQPVEGSIFSWLTANNVPFDNMGEQLGAVSQDVKYGAGGFVTTSSTRPDSLSACYMATRARVLCDLKPFTYAWYVNDHTFGGAAGRPNPALMISVNDEATGMFVDALSHSPLWKGALVVVVEDDPSDGVDHVDAHRSIVTLASPWVKRGYVSHTHFDVSSLHKLFAHLLGLPYNHQAIADAALPLDLFTSTPDYTPFTYLPRSFTDLSCNPKGTQSALQAEGWDFSDADDQPGLNQQVWRIVHDGEL
jgi:DNA-binding beta-propeller fold protein YncE